MKKWEKDKAYCQIIPINPDATINGGTFKKGYSQRDREEFQAEIDDLLKG